jgi:anti-sigma factor RsiW
MNPEPHRKWRELLGALALGRLTEEDRAALDEHLEGCDECRAEAAEVARVVALLPAAEVGRINERTAPPDGLEDRVVSHVLATRLRERRRGGWRLAAGLGVAAALLSIFAVIVLRPSGEPPTPPGPEQVTFQALPPGAEATAELTPGAQVTEIKIRVRRMPPGDYVVAMERADGTAVEADSFSAPSGSWSGKREVALPRGEAVVLTLTQVEGETVVTAPLPPV